MAMYAGSAEGRRKTMDVKQRKILSELLEEAAAEWDAYLDDCRAEEMEPEVTYYDFLANRISENGVLLPPVRVGDTVYYIVGGYYKSPDNCKVSEPCKVVEISYKIGSEYRQLAGFITNKGTRYSFDGIGKTVFLTREEAEVVLRRRKERKRK
jgi:hypothetical protein